MQEQNMRWLINAFTRRRLNDEKMKCAREAMASLIQRIPAGSPIDATQLANNALAIAEGMVVAFVKQRLI